MNEFISQEEVMLKYIKNVKNLGRALFLWFIKHYRGFRKYGFSFIPNTAETSFYGLIGAVQDHVRDNSLRIDLKQRSECRSLTKLLSSTRIEKIAIKDAKLRTFITEDQ